MRKVYYAKSRLNNGQQPTVSEHLSRVAELAGIFGAALDMEKEAFTSGLWHDVAKNSRRFEGVLKGVEARIDHALSSAALIYLVQKGTKNLPAWRAVIEAINGHHDGLLQFDILERYIKDSFCSNRPIETYAGKTAALAGDVDFSEAFRAFKCDFPSYKLPKLYRKLPDDVSQIAIMLYTRMLFSCLVDADYSASAMDEDPNYLAQTESIVFDPKLLLERLYAYRNGIIRESKADKALNRIRNELFELCGKVKDLKTRLYTLTAPTGTAKTLALLHFALTQCLQNRFQRIIVVLPYLSLVEQSMRTYARIIPDILEDHSQSNLCDEARHMSERWSAPFIITTSVRFFETLFADKPGDCRKLHNIANSVILFDESQSLPPQVTSATLQAVQALCERYNSVMVFSTATQPDFAAIKSVNNWNPIEIVPDYKSMYAALKRVNVDWRLKNSTSLEDIAAEMAEKAGVCAIVNLRRHARELYNEISKRSLHNDVFFITTDLCPSHREYMIKRIRELQSAGLPCIVVATQCIEAGVDLDFEYMFRALAPLEAIIQAAGRNNRNGLVTGGGHMVVFIPMDNGNLYPSAWYESAANIVHRLCLEMSIDIDNPEHIKAYYQELFSNAEDHKNLTTAIADGNYEAVAKEYKLIPEKGIRVIVPYKAERVLYESVTKRALTGGISPVLMKEAAPITVTVQAKHTDEYLENLPYVVSGHKYPSDYYVLRPQYHHLYTQAMGLQLPNATTLEHKKVRESIKDRWYPDFIY